MKYEITDPWSCILCVWIARYFYIHPSLALRKMRDLFTKKVANRVSTPLYHQVARVPSVNNMLRYLTS